VFYQLVNLLVSYELAIQLTVVEFGEYQFYLSLAFFSVMLLKLGVDEGLVYSLPKYSNAQASSILWLIFGVYVLIFYILFSIKVPGNYLLSLANLGLSYELLLNISLSFFCLTYLGAVLRAKGYIVTRVVGIYVVSPVVMLALIVVKGGGVDSILSYRVDSFWMAVLVMALAFVISNRRFEFENSCLRIKNVMKISLGIFVLQVFQSGIEQSYLALVIVKYLDTEIYLGFYSFAIRYSALLAMVVIIFNGFFVPIMASMMSSGRHDELKDAYLLGSNVAIAMSCIAFILLYSFVHEIVELIDIKFLPAIGFIKILLFAHFSTLLFGLNLPIIFFYNKKYELYNLLFCCLVMLVIGLWLANMYGALGVAYAALLSHILMNLIRARKVYKILGGNIYKNLNTHKGLISILIFVGFFEAVPEKINVEIKLWVSILLVMFFVGRYYTSLVKLAKYRL